MDTSKEARLAALEATFSTVDITPLASVEELARSERARAARHFGFTQPEFRTSIALRFYGDGVEGHDLDGGTAGSVISGFSGAVDAAGSQLHLPPGSTKLFLSPAVASGSTILELFGAPAPPTDRLDIEIDDTPVDAALRKLFSILEDVVSAETDPSSITPIEGPLGKKLFSLARSLLDGNVDLDLTWTQPRGSTTTTKLDRGVARALRALLDIDSTESEQRTEVGTLTSISTTGIIGFQPRNRKTALSISTADSDMEGLRELWAKTVEAVWTEVVVSHPQRDSKKITNNLVSIRETPSEEKLE